MGLTCLGVYFGILYAPVLLQSGILMPLLIVELLIVVFSGWWVRLSPLNLLLFALFPLSSGITVTPLLLSVTAGYANGGVILLNALGATACMVAAAGVLAYLSGFNLSRLGTALFLSVLGLIVLGVLQLFIPAMQTGAMELFISGAGVLIFALFTAYDLQRIGHLSKMGMSPFLLALSLYLDIFNLFLYVLRFMVALSGNRR